jgi:sporulation protein YlmC with PRC-barrel domain
VIRYERGSRVVATDGLVGTLRQVVIDEDQGEIKALVIRANATKELVLVPPDLVDKSVGDTLLLQVTREQFHAGASRSPRFNRRMFTAADCRNVARRIPLVFQGDRQRSLVRLSQNSVETSDRLERSSPPKPAGSLRPRWRLFARDAHAARSALSATGAD